MSEGGPTDAQQEENAEGRPLWHLAELTHWQDALRTGTYDRSTRGATLAEVGFVHASWPEQLPGVAKVLYARVAEPLVVLEIDPGALEQAGVEVRVEPGDPQDPASPLFPHLYGPLPVSAVTRTRPAAVEKGWLDLGPWEARA
ncbi:DUF952 domain-containing protein [Ornithinimicrobium pekingense]|uniref:DUF952 domain-containing protein n=1 Tax=Ornithinimicrobium pekingense TaxID=384677 RepID=A0ABQ2F9S0_9MICO|nr:DUF952 domain-containing protein [Ornithinimicrobium pekingense]GGK67504.1 hypothetical protein GCM10011509_14820 [Ornithinimicrobium pekingense]